MSTRVRLTLGLLLLPLIGCGGSGANSDDQPLTGSDPGLNGTWTATRMEEGGKPLSVTEMKKLITTYQFANGTLTSKNSRNETQTMAYTVDPTTNPKRISFDVKGVKSKDVYEINGKELKLCMSLDGKKYPTEVVSKPNSTDLVVFTRQ